MTRINCKMVPLVHLFSALVLCAAASMLAADSKFAPTHADVSFGPHPHQLLDVYLPPDATAPAPVLIWFGGIWQPSKHAPDVKRFFAAHCAVIASETRTLTDGMADKNPAPISYVMNDACRAVQFARSKAAEWNLDPHRIAVGGSSQGALPALFVGCAGERSDPNSADSIERLSTTVIAVGAHRSQPSIDPMRMREWVPGVSWGAPALGCNFEESLRRRDELLPLISKWSPDALLHAGAAPIYFENNWGLTQPENVSEADYKVHSPAWALGFQVLAQKAGVECFVKYPEHPTEKYAGIWDFLVLRLTAK